MTDDQTKPGERVEDQKSTTPADPAPAPKPDAETKNIEEESDPLGANFA